MLKTYRYRIYPTSSQKELLAKHFGAVRYLYNLALETKIYAYKTHKINISRFELSSQLTELKSEYAWLKEINSQSLQMSLKNLDTAYANFFKGRSEFPKYKKRSNSQSFQCPQNVSIDDKLYLPKFKEGIQIIRHRNFNGTIKTCTVSKTPTDKYFVSVLVETENILPVPVLPKTKYDCLGIDTGIKTLATCSDGREIENLKFLKNNIAKLKVLQKRASRKKKGSNNRKKANKRVAVLHEKITNKRLNHIHQETHKLTKDNQFGTICVEDLGIKNMVKNHKLAQSLSDVSLSKFYEILEYKCKWQGINLVKVGRFYASTKICNCCGHKNPIDDLKIRKWDCTNCNTHNHRDPNSSLNIRDEGYKILTGMERTEEPDELLAIAGAETQEKFLNVV